MKAEIIVTCLLLGIHWFTYGIIPIVGGRPITISFRDHTLVTTLICWIACYSLTLAGATSAVFYILSSIATVLTLLLSLPISLWDDYIVLGINSKKCRSLLKEALQNSDLDIALYGPDFEIGGGSAILRVRKWNTYHSSLVVQQFEETPDLNIKIEEQFRAAILAQKTKFNKGFAWFSLAIGLCFLALPLISLLN